MWIIIGIIIIIIVIICILSSSSNDTNNSNTYYIPTRHYNIQDCISEKDIQYKLNKADKEIVEKVEKSQAEIKRAIEKANGKIEATWISSYKKILEVSNSLNINIEKQISYNFGIKKFRYYIELHFRSMIASNFAYNEYDKIKQTYNEINNLIKDINDGKVYVSQSDKKMYNNMKNDVKVLKDLYFKKVTVLNNNTKDLKEKIGKECGHRGKKWLEALNKRTIEKRKLNL